MKYDKSFKKTTRYPHKRSEGLTRRGATRQERLMLGREPARTARLALAFMDRGASLKDGVNLALSISDSKTRERE
jgi:hypothetical protein